MSSEDQKYFKRNEVLSRQVSRAYMRHVNGHGATLQGKHFPCSGIARPGVPVHWKGGSAGCLILPPKRGGGSSLPNEVDVKNLLYPLTMSADDVVELELEE